MANKPGKPKAEGTGKFQAEEPELDPNWAAGESEEDSEKGAKGISDAFKKVLSAGIGAAFMTEETIRSYLSDVRLPKDVLNLIIQSAGKSKEELLNRVGNEVVKIISKIDFVKEASRFVEEHKFRISAEVEVVRKEKSVEDKSSTTP